MLLIINDKPLIRYDERRVFMFTCFSRTRERERERDRQTDKEREREREREANVSWRVCACDIHNVLLMCC